MNPTPRGPAASDPSGADAFAPDAWLAHPHVQTLVGRWLRSEDGPPLRRERWTTPDDDFLDLDFTPDPDPSAPLVLVLHGLEGNARRNYCREAYRQLIAHGMACVGLNFRTCSGEMNRQARAYHSGETDDPAFVLERLAERFPGRRLGLLGFSLGGNVALKYLGERSDPRAAAAAVISVPFDLLAGSRHLEHSWIGRNVYLRYFLRSLQTKMRAKADLFRGLPVQLGRALAARTIREFDDSVTAPLHGFADAEDYYRRCSSARFLPEVRTPTVIVHSMDDPFLPPAAVPVDAIARNPHLHARLTGRGGHVGFVEARTRPTRFWAEREAARFLAGALAGA